MRQPTNPFDGMDGAKAVKLLLDSRCSHGYSARKRCPKCQSVAANARWNPTKGHRRRRSVYEGREDASA